MSYKKDQQQEFRELAGWVIDQTKQAGANDCKVSISKRRFVEINYRDRKPEVIKEATTQGLYLEVFVDNRFAGKSTPDFRKSTLAGFITDLIDNARIMEEDPFRTLPDPKYYAGRSTSRSAACRSDTVSSLHLKNAMPWQKPWKMPACKREADKVISVEAGEYDETYEEFVHIQQWF